MIHDNSIQSYAEMQEKLGSRHKQIVSVLRKHPRGLTDRDVMMELGKTDPNSVRPRITELIKKGLVEESLQPAQCAVSGRNVRVVRLAGEGQGLLAL
jgi:predicted ArsR family transcriptional regulator